MKIKTKLALLYTSITVGVLMVVFVFVYILTLKNIDDNYYTLLFDKALITAQKHFEKDELSQHAYQKILDTYESLLPETAETVIVANDREEAAKELRLLFDDRQIDELFSRYKIKFKLEDKSGAGIYYPDNEGNFIILVTAGNLQGDYLKSSLKRILLIVLIISSMIIFALLWWNARMITKPLEEMVAGMQQITSRDLHLRLAERKGNDELSQTISYFNRMIGRLEISFNSQKTFIANASHELKNPLAAIMGECEVMQFKEFSPDEYRVSIQRIESEVERLNTLVDNLFQLVQTDLDMSGAEQLDVVEELESFARYFKHSKYNWRVVFRNIETPFYIKSNKHLLFVAFQNIIDNACKYSESLVVVSASKDRHGFQIKVSDRGIGIPADEKDKIFDTFYRARNTHNYNGSGIGLSLAHKILTLSHAELHVASTENAGTSLVIVWKNTF